MQNLSLEKLAALIHGRIVLESYNNRIPLSVGRFSTTPPSSITFLIKPFEYEQALLTQFKNHDVRCVIVKAPNILTLEKWKKANISVIEVENLSESYKALVIFYRGQFFIPFIQVIGSSGKTTTKEMIGAVLNEKFPTLTTIQNMNSPLGVAKNLFRLNKTHRVAVLEAGMKAPGVIRKSSRLIKPDIGVVTSIHSAHLARFGSIQKIIDAKAEILEFLSKKGTLIINWDDENCHKFPLETYKGSLIRFGFSEHCDLWASDIQRHGFRTNFIVNTRYFEFPCAINIIGRYNVGNALAAVAVGLIVGLSPMEISQGLEKFKPMDGRLKVYYKSNGAVIIDDNFNANPDSTRMLIDELIIMSHETPVVLVIGDMERPSQDIERYARTVHFNIGRQLAQGNFIHVLAVGFWAIEYVTGAIHYGFPRKKITHYRTVDEAESAFARLLTPGTTVVLKASPYTKLNRLYAKYSHLLY